MKKTKITRFLELNLGSNSGSVERFAPSRFKPDTELETLRVLYRASKDKKLKGILVNTSGFHGERAYIWELQKALLICKNSGKKIAGYFDNADLDLYCLLSVSDRIIMDSSGILSFLGYSWGRFFVKETLEKLGVGFRELRYMDYKSANETFSRTSISDADKEQYGKYLDEIFDYTKNAIINNRSLNNKSINEESFNALLKEGIMLSAGQAKARGLIDDHGREETIIKTLKALEFENPEDGDLVFITAGNPGCSLFNINRKAAVYSPGRTKFLSKEIAVVHARGNTDLDQGMGARNIARTIRQLADKSRVKALVIRIDSPGGSAVAADHISEAILEVKEYIPVVVSLGQVAASGGYWAAMNASRIVTSPYTLTGSIGVIGGWFFEKGLNTKLGLGFEAMTRGEHADLVTGIILPRRDLDEDEEAQFRRCLLDLYDEFIKKAAKGRNTKDEDLEALARGRVYSGLSAQNLGLIDSLGGYLDALEIAKELAAIPLKKKIRVREYPKPKFLEALTAKFFNSAHINSRIEASLAVPGFLTAANALNANQILEDLRFRLSKNGQAMPILPLN